MKKIFLYISLIFITLLILIFFLSRIAYVKEREFFSYYNIFKVIDTFLPQTISSTLRMLSNNNINSKRIKNDYNVKFLPNTQYNKMDFKKIPLEFIKLSDIGYLNTIKRKTFYIDFYNNNLFVMPKNGLLYYQNINDVEKNISNFKRIDSNLDANFVLDLLIKDKKIYVSYVEKNNNCAFLKLASSNISLDKIKFKDIFTSDECMQLIQAGRIQKIVKKDNTYILLSTQSHTFEREDERDLKPQDDNSIYGKIIAINENDNSYKIFSKGHRNILGLLVDGDVILSTENGPRGADEINRVYEGKNYGWDIASYGKKYYLDESYKDHYELGFEEPIFSFIPSLGISEIIKIDNNFDDDWKENYLAVTMYDRHLLRLKFNKNYKKLDYYEKIFIGERMRDIKYFSDKSMIILALEDTGSLGILKNLKGFDQARKKNK